MGIDLKYFKGKLEGEKILLEKELSSVGRINPSNPEDWEPTPSKLNVQKADSNEMADRIEDFEEKSAVEVELENRLVNIKEALKKIEDGKYGICEVGGGQIEEARLEANPAAKTCMKHINE